MEILKILKRDGTVEEFNFDKIKTAVGKAYASCGKQVNETVLSLIHSEIVGSHYLEPVSVETIQDIVERKIGAYDFDVAKEYILYREKHKQARVMAEKNIDFINNYMGSDNTANATVDDNSNVYKTSYIRKLLNSQRFLNRFNSEFVDHIKQTTVHTEKYVTRDKLWLLSHEEVNSNDSFLKHNHKCIAFEMFKAIDLAAYSRMLLELNVKNIITYSNRFKQYLLKIIL